MNFRITDKILKIINYTLFFIYVFVFTLSTAICKVWGNINLMHIKTLTCDNCLDLYGLKVGLQLLSVCIGVAGLSTILFFCGLKKLHKDNNCYFPIGLLTPYLVAIICIIWHFFFRGSFFNLFMLFCVFAALYLLNLHRNYKPLYIFILLILFFPSILVLLPYNHPLFFYKYKGMGKVVDVTNMRIKSPRNLIVVYVESFNKSLDSIVYKGKKYSLDDSEAVHFNYFKEGMEQGTTIGALTASLTGMFLSHYYPNGRSVSRLTAKQGYQNLFIKESSIYFANTLKFLLDEGFEDENIYGREKFTYSPVCVKMSKKIYGNEEFKSKLDWWPGECDQAGFELFKQKLSVYSDNIPFFAIFFTLDFHAGSNPYYFDDKEMKAANITNINNFIHWFHKQKFYNNTTLIVLADHAKMSTQHKGEEPLYNAFYNLPPRLLTDLNTNRTFNQMDMYVTMLDILGFDLPSSQIGYSTSLFSDEKTVAERYNNDAVLDKDDGILYILQQSKSLWDALSETFVALCKNVRKYI